MEKGVSKLWPNKHSIFRWNAILSDRSDKEYSGTSDKGRTLGERDDLSTKDTSQCTFPNTFLTSLQRTVPKSRFH